MREHPLLPAAAREVAAVLVAGATAAVAWLIVVQEAAKKGVTDLVFNQELGHLLAEQEDIARRQGFLATVVLGLVVAVVHALLRPVLRARWQLRGLVTGALVFLAWGLVFCPIVDGDAASGRVGLFGNAHGSATIVLFAVAAATAGLVLSRVHALMRDADWWEPKHFDLRESLDQVFQDSRRPGPPSGG